MAQYLEALQAEDLGVMVAGNHFAAVQTMDEESTQVVRFEGAFGTNKKIIRTITPADADTFSFSALLLKPNQPGARMANESFMRDLDGNFRVVASRGDGEHFVYEQCVWTTLRIASTMDNVTLTADFQGLLTSFPKSALNGENIANAAATDINAF